MSRCLNPHRHRQSQQRQTATPTPASTPTPAIAATPTPTPILVSTPTPTPTLAPGPLTASEIFEKVSSSIAFITNNAWTGSGVLLEDGHVVTNAHVVWPFDSARVVFPDGSEFHEVPVRGWDLLADLAVLGPINRPTDGLALSDGEGLPIGANLFLIGYPAETEKFPQPTIVRGLLSRVREWESVGNYVPPGRRYNHRWTERRGAGLGGRTRHRH